MTQSSASQSGQPLTIPCLHLTSDIKHSVWVKERCWYGMQAYNSCFKIIVNVLLILVKHLEDSFVVVINSKGFSVFKEAPYPTYLSIIVFFVGIRSSKFAIKKRKNNTPFL